MNIISKYKDYYDYLAHIYGIDNKIVLDRRVCDGEQTGTGIVNLHICDYTIHGYVKDDVIYWLDQIESIALDFDATTNEYIIDEGFLYNRTRRKKYMFPCNVNSLNNCAIMMDGTSKNMRYPRLYKLGINKVLSAKDIYLMLTAWLAPKDVVVNRQTDKEKILSNGFDLKTSFRKIK